MEQHEHCNHEHEHHEDCGCGHHHDHEHEHHEGCGCGHHHEHEHHEDCGCGHHHDHEHEHHEGCGCGHHHDHDHELGEQIIHGSYTFSHEGTLTGGAVTLAQAMDRVEAVLLEAAGRVEVAGIIPGHLKALLKNDDVYAVLSVTRPGHCDRTCSKLPEEARVWALTVNLISAVHPEQDPENVVMPLFY